MFLMPDHSVAQAGVSTPPEALPAKRLLTWFTDSTFTGWFWGTRDVRVSVEATCKKHSFQMSNYPALHLLTQHAARHPSWAPSLCITACSSRPPAHDAADALVDSCHCGLTLAAPACTGTDCLVTQECFVQHTAQLHVA